MTLFTTDDFCPQHLDFFRKYVEPLHKKYPNFKIYCFTTAKWHNLAKNDCLKSKKFMDYCLKNKDWVKIAAHGIKHDGYEGKDKKYSSEFEECMNFLNKMAEKGCAVINAYKPPYYSWDSDSLFRAKKAGFKLFFIQDGFVDLELYKVIKRNDIKIIDSHTNPDKNVNLQDRIDLEPFKIIETEFSFAKK
jgi:hypothetical protein